MRRRAWYDSLGVFHSTKHERKRRIRKEAKTFYFARVSLRFLFLFSFFPPSSTLFYCSSMIIITIIIIFITTLFFCFPFPCPDSEVMSRVLVLWLQFLLLYIIPIVGMCVEFFSLASLIFDCDFVSSVFFWFHKWIILLAEWSPGRAGSRLLYRWSPMAGNRFVGDSKLELESFVFGNSKRTLDHSGFFFK